MQTSWPLTPQQERPDEELLRYLLEGGDRHQLTFEELKRGLRLVNQMQAEQYKTDARPLLPVTGTGVEDYVAPTIPLNRLLGFIGGTVGSFTPMPIVGSAVGAGLGTAVGHGAEYLTGSRQEMPSLSDIGQEMAINAALQAGPTRLAQGLRRGARAVYRGLLKPSLSQKGILKAQEIVETAVDEGIPITERGSKAIEQLKNEIGRQIQQEGQRLAQAGGRINLHALANRLRAWAKLQYDQPGQDPAMYQHALAVAARIDQHPSLRAFPGAFPRQSVDVDEALKIKRRLYEQAGPEAFGWQAGPGLAVEAQTAKKGSLMFKQATEAEAQRLTGLPGAQTVLAQLNKRESKLLPAARAIRAAVEREANQSRLRDLTTYTLAAGGGAGVGYAGGNPLLGALTGIAARRALRADIMSHLTLLTDRLATGLGVSGPTASRLAYYLLTTEVPEEPAQSTADDINRAVPK